MQCGQAGRTLVLSDGNAGEVALTHTGRALTARSLTEVVNYLLGKGALTDVLPTPGGSGGLLDVPDLADVRGQPQARRALEIAAAGQHNLLFIGPPGTGKTMLASRLPGILPPMNEEDALVSASVYSISTSGEGWLERCGGHFERRIIPPQGWRWWAVAVTPGRERFHWHMPEYCFWTNCQNTAARCWMYCESRWKVAEL